MAVFALYMQSYKDDSFQGNLAQKTMLLTRLQRNDMTYDRTFILIPSFHQYV